MSIVTITGPTCAGKTTLEQELKTLGYGRAISHTTRLPRQAELNGQHYHFVTDEEYDTLHKAGDFVETVEFGNARYAMSQSALIKAQQEATNVVIVVEPHGAEQIHDFCLKNQIDSYAVWVDCNAKSQANRFLMRMLADMLVGRDAVGIYADRLRLMLTEETEWRQRIAAGQLTLTSGPGVDYKYDMILQSDTLTPPQMAQRVRVYVSMQQQMAGRVIA